MTLMNRLAERRSGGSDEGKPARSGLKVMSPAGGEQKRTQVTSERAGQV